MPEILTESFCERCGTRYTFESARQRVRLKGVKVLSRGLKNFVLSDSTSIDEAMASARAETDRQVTTNQLDAFHQTFSFCLSCRQYTCSNCWNTVEARCLSCAPDVADDGLAAAAGAMPAMPQVGVTGPATVHATNGSNGHAPAGGAAIAAGATFQTLTDAAAGGVIEPVEVEAPLEVAAVNAATEPSTVSEQVAVAKHPAAVAAEVAPAAAPTPRTTADVGARTAAQTAALLRRFRPGQNIDAELDAYEQDRTSSLTAAARAVHEPEAIEAGPVAEPIAATPEPIAAAPQRVAPEPQPIAAEHAVSPAATAPEPQPAESIPAAAPVASEPEPIAAQPEPAPEPVAAEPPAAPPIVRTTPPRTGFGRRAAAKPVPAPRSPVADLVVQPTWQRVAPDVHPEQQPTAPSNPAAPSTPVPASVAATPPLPAAAPIAAAASPRDSENSSPQWPAQPQWPVSAPAKGLPFLNRPPVPESGMEGLWAASIREVVATPRVPGKPANAVQPCLSCGLSLSANARFCRRCGTPQV